MVGFCVHRIGVTMYWLAIHMLHPMHSRISSGRPSLILFGRKGSAIEGRAAPMKSTRPRFTIDTIVSGEVSRPTDTTGLHDTLRTCSSHGSIQFSCAKRE